MQCFWCHNPEGRCPEPELQYFADRCITCGECANVCPEHAHEMNNGTHLFIRERCASYGKCVEACNADALKLSGREMTVEQVMNELLRDRLFYESSDGGITLSGGEPVMSSQFARRILERCKIESLHTTIDTCGHYPWKNLLNVLPFTDLILMDIKLMDSEKHKRLTGVSNDLIIKNARRIACTDKPVIFRTPVVPSVNDTTEEIAAIASFIRHLFEIRIKYGPAKDNNAGIQYELLPFHQFAGDKYQSLGLIHDAFHLMPPTKQKMQELIKVAKSYGLSVINQYH